MSTVDSACPCGYCEQQRQEAANDPKPGWLQREFEAAQAATAPPAAGSWIKIQPGCVMPPHHDDLMLRLPGCSGSCRIGWFEKRGFYLYGDEMDRLEPTHYAIINPPEPTA